LPKADGASRGQRRPASNKGPTRSGHLRIIGGRFRGRKLPVPNQPGLRPTTDRVRETLFNWLAPDIAGSRCLDCFAGSGALGFEALSRGAADVVLVERAARVVAQLQQNARLLREAGAQGDVEVVQADILTWLKQRMPSPADIVFVDPPFRDALAEVTCRLLVRGFVRAGSMIYVETPGNAPPPTLPSGWEWFREQHAGQVRYAIAVVTDVISGKETGVDC
jgi:16S rRNA (guanine966-N2)-methyltransferase